MSLFHTRGTHTECLPITFYTDDVVSVRDQIYGEEVQSLVNLVGGVKEVIPESEGRRLRDVLELELATEQVADLYLDHERIAKLTEAAETNPEASRFRITVPILSDVPPAAQIDL